MKGQVEYEPETAKIYDANKKLSRILGNIKHCIHDGRMTELVNFVVRKRLIVAVILGCDFCAQFVAFIYPETRAVDSFDASTVPITCAYFRKRLEATENTKIVCLSKRNGCVCPKLRSTQIMRIPPFSRAVISVQTEGNDLILVTPRAPTGNLIECSAARGTQNIIRNKAIRIIAANFTAEKETISRNQVFAMA